MNVPKAESNLTRWIFPLILLFILMIAAGVRGLDLNWDEGTHLHPDERYLTMVVSAIDFPASMAEYWDTAQSPLNPVNRGHGNYVYGTLPLFTIRAVGRWIDAACGESPQAMAQGLRQLLLGTNQPCWPGTYTGYYGIHLVGRALSGLIDLLALVGLALLARRLYGPWVGLLAAAFYALAVLPIQQAHYFVVDSFASVFVVWTLYFTVRAVQTHSRWALLFGGMCTGFAVASKISVWPLAGMVGLAGLFIFLEERRRFPVREMPAIESSSESAPAPEDLESVPAEEDLASAPAEESPAAPAANHPAAVHGFRLPIWIALGISGLMAFLAFRIAQPYAFSGPGFFGISIAPGWIENMRYIRNLMSGAIDAPYAHQWTNRTPIVFPWINMVFWGLGLPLGLAAWIGWAVMGWKLIRNRESRHWVPWVWGTLFFLYQSTQWVKSIRYLLPVYAVFILFAAWGLVGLATSRWGRRNVAVRMVPVLVLIGTMLWCWGFLQTYFQPFSRAAASRWMFENIPPAAVLETQNGQNLPAPLQVSATLNGPDVPITARVQLTGNQVGKEFVLRKVDGMGAAGERQLQIVLSADANEAMPLATVSTRVDVPERGSVPAVFTLPDVPLAGGEGRFVFVSIRLMAGAPVLLDTTVVGNEHWDDPLPVSLDGKNAYGEWYRGLHTSSDGLMQVYGDDTPEKRAQLLDWLDEVDYIVLSSNRQYASIPRLPTRYPLTIAYYRALFDGSLGFALDANIGSFTTIGPCQFDDQEAPFPIPPARYANAASCSIAYPPAEEAFSVYDHPRVLIFVKTPAYSRQKAEAVLPATLLDNFRWVTPLQFTQGKLANLMLSARQWEQQQLSGTWSELFDRMAPQNWGSAIAGATQPPSIPFLAIFLWWGMLTLLGWIAFPWIYLAMPALRDRGYGLARIAGLLLWSYPAWLLASFQWVPHTRLLLWIIFLLLATASGIVIYRRRQEFKGFLRVRRSMIVWCEVLFAVLYLLWVFVRFLNPDLWHPVSGGEKPMDFAYLNAVIKSVAFPPYDPWFSGGQMNYYYYGFVLIGSLIKALGIVPSLAYNLAVPSLFALTGVGAYSLANNLAGGDSRRGHRAGLWGTLLVLLLGNLGEVQLLFKGFQDIGGIDFPSLIPGYPQVISALAGFWKVIFEGEPLVFRPEWWYWNASRVIPTSGPYDPGTINEFPLFTFLYADLHAHMIAFPLTQLALGIALQWGIAGSHFPAVLDAIPASDPAPRWKWWIPQPGLTLIWAGLTAGALRATNTWDYPTYLVLMGVAPLLKFLDNAGTLFPKDQPSIDRPPFYRRLPYRQLLILPAAFILAELLFRPYVTHYTTVYSRFGSWNGSRTPLGSYFIIYGHLLFPLVLLLVYSVWNVVQRVRRSTPEIASALGVLGVGGLALTAVLAGYMDIPVAWIAIPIGLGATLVILDENTPPRRRLLWFWIGTAMTFSLFVEIFVLEGDIGRLNTVFKFYLQVWMLLALSAAVATERFLGYPVPQDTAAQPDAAGAASWLHRNLYRFNDWMLAIFACLIFSAGLYPLFAIPARIRDRWNPEAPKALDGTAYMGYVTQYEHGGEVPLPVDQRVIQWLQENVTGTPVIMEGQGEREYLWGGRVSIYTGLPSVAGWRWHQVQQRSVMPAGTVEKRQSDVVEFYNTDSPDRAMEILNRYSVRYIVLTPYERAYMLPEGEPKFATLVNQGRLEIVYRESQATIYRVK